MLSLAFSGCLVKYRACGSVCVRDLKKTSPCDRDPSIGFGASAVRELQASRRSDDDFTAGEVTIAGPSY